MAARRTPRERAIAGRSAEAATVDLLIATGWAILGTNIRVGRLEVDVLARRGPVVAIVEVRTRGAGSWLGAFASIDSKKKARLREAAKRLWRRFEADASVQRIRVDVASVDLETTPVSVEIAEAVA